MVCTYLILFKIKLLEQKNKEDNERLSNTIAELMDVATEKTRSEVEVLKKIYNSNIEKLIEECSILEMVFDLEIIQINVTFFL